MPIIKYERIVEDYWCVVPLQGRGARGTTAITCFMPENDKRVHFVRGVFQDYHPTAGNLSVSEVVIRRTIRNALAVQSGLIRLRGHGRFLIQRDTITFRTDCGEAYPIPRSNLQELLDWIEAP